MYQVYIHDNLRYCIESQHGVDQFVKSRVYYCKIHWEI